MNQTAYRSALGATPRRLPAGVPLSGPEGVGGINSRVQQTGEIIARFGRPGPRIAQPVRPIRPAGLRNVNGINGVNSRVQQTGEILARFSRSGPSAAQRVSVGMGAVPWLWEGMTLALAANYIDEALSGKQPPSALEVAVERKDLARKLHNPFEGAGIVGPGSDQYVYVPAPSTSLSGLGAYQPAGATSSQAAAPPPLPSSVGGAAVTVAASAITSGSSLASGATWLAAAGGPIGLAVAGVTIGLTALFSRKKPGQKRATTEIVDSVEPLLIENLNGYLAGPRTISSQRQAVANFEAGWQYVADSCGQPDMGTPGQWCIGDRQRGGKWDWFRRYLDPILDDPDVIADPPPGMTASVNPQTGEREYVVSAGGDNTALLLLAAGAALVFML